MNVCIWCVSKQLCVLGANAKKLVQRPGLWWSTTAKSLQEDGNGADSFKRDLELVHVTCVHSKHSLSVREMNSFCSKRNQGKILCNSSLCSSVDLTEVRPCFSQMSTDVYFKRIVSVRGEKFGEG